MEEVGTEYQWQLMIKKVIQTEDLICSHPHVRANRWRIDIESTL